MEEVTSQEAAESPRGHFQPLENQSECLSPELRFLQDTDMEQGFSGGFPISKPDGISEREQDLQVFDLESKNREVIRGDCSGPCSTTKRQTADTEGQRGDTMLATELKT
uniref:Zinc finger protein 655 n=1 Tax=Mus musculus TaxID=10090 RepID=A0ABJ3HP35_MOUSE